MPDPACPRLTLHDVFRHNARYFADRPAIRIDGAAMLYSELTALVDQTLLVLGPHVTCGDRVGLWMPNGFAWVASFLALNALGAVCVPINTRLVGAELRTIMSDADARLLITTTHYRKRAYLDEAVAAFDGVGTTPTLIAATDGLAPGAWPVIASTRRNEPAPLELPADLLCIQYTSGTTSTPKGVMLTNANYLRTAAYVARCQRLTPASHFISAGPFFHCSGSMHAITTCLVAGSTLHSMTAWDPEHYLQLVQAHQCDVSHMIYYRDVLALNLGKVRQQLASMRVAHDLGTRDYLLRLHDELGLAGISNIYGMTETSGQFTMWFPDDPLESRISANGRPQPGNHVRMGDPVTGMALPPGASGEIQMSGATLSPGYFNRPEANAAAYTADGWLRSGDLGRLTEQGELVYIARLKEIIRVGGENLAPAEVEQALRDHSGLTQVCVLGLPHERLDEVPAAVVVGADDATVSWPEVLTALRGQLAGFKVPQQVYLAESFPMTATNRVQRAVLKDWIAEGRLTRAV